MSQEAENSDFSIVDPTNPSYLQNSHNSENQSNPQEKPAFVDERDLLQVVYQTSTVLQLQTGFPKASDYVSFHWAEFKASVGIQGWISIFIGAAIALGPFLKLLKPMIQAAQGPSSEQSFWLALALFGFIALLVAVLCLGQVPIRQSWKFDRINGSLIWNRKTLFLGARRKTLWLKDFQNIEILDVEKSSLFNQHTLELLKVPKRQRSQTQYFPLVGVGSAGAPDLSARLQVAKEFQTKIQKFMGWSQL
jgi:hypothetical protein